MIKKCIFPVAGYGTRFLPATKAMPKEILPVLDKPLVQYGVEEALEAGLTFALDEVAVDDAAGLSAPIAYETLLIDPTRPPERPKPGYVLSAAVLARLAPFGAAGQAAIRKRGRATTLVA